MKLIHAPPITCVPLRDFPALFEAVGELAEVVVDAKDDAVDVVVSVCSFLADDVDAVLVSVTNTPEAVPVTVPVLVAAVEFEDEEDVLLSPVTPHTSVNLVQPVANSPAHQDPLDINQ